MPKVTVLKSGMTLPSCPTLDQAPREAGAGAHFPLRGVCARGQERGRLRGEKQVTRRLQLAALSSAGLGPQPLSPPTLKGNKSFVRPLIGLMPPERLAKSGKAEPEESAGAGEELLLLPLLRIPPDK